MLKKWFVLILLVFSIPVFAQTDSTSTNEEDDDDEGVLVKHNMNEQHKFGLKLGVGFCTVTGEEMSNPRPLVGISGSVYYRYKLNEKLAIQPEAGIGLRGSNFNNNNGEYSKLRLYYFDMPMLMVYAINEPKTTHIIGGLQYARLLNASIYVEPNSVAEGTPPALIKNDWSLLAGVQFYGGIVGFQCLLKYGLVNINDGLIPNLNPSFKNKDIHTFALECSLLF